jgi:L-idonate 5-dehydrogenase
MGADHTINLMKTPDALAAYKADKGQFDVVFEASGSAPAFMNALDVVRARGVVVVVGVGAEVNLSLSQVVAKEVDVRGTFRFHSEFATAVRFLNDRLVDGRPVITTQPLSAAVAAFDMAADKSKSLKVQIAFDA